MAKLAIKGHPTRGGEVIKLLEMLGGVNKHKIDAIRQNYVYFIDMDNIIRLLQINQLLPEKDSVYSLEEFEEKFPYKVGDKVTTIYGKEGIVSKLIWSQRDECVRYELEADLDSLYFENELQPYKEESMKKDTNKAIFEGNAQSCDIMNDIIKEETMEDKDIIEQTTEINLNHPCFDGHNKIELIIPENWKFEQRGNKMFGIRKYPQCPKTYAECCDILNIEMNRILHYEDGLGYREITQYDINLSTRLKYFRRLLICRDAYWKIAGEQMGLDKPWKYDMSKNEFSCAISYEYGSIQKCEVRYRNHFLVFPTKEMRDEFYNNFKDLIDSCKELL